MATAVVQNERLSRTQTLSCIIDAPGLGYPSRSCVPTVLRSVSPGSSNVTTSRIIEHPLMPKNPGGLGAGPQEALATRITIQRNSKYFLNQLLTKIKTVAVPFVGEPSATAGKGTGTEPIAPNNGSRTHFGSEPVPFPHDS